MTIDDVLKYYKTSYGLQKITKMSHANINNWKVRGYIPIATQMKLERLSNGALKADLKHCGIGVDDDHI